MQNFSIKNAIQYIGLTDLFLKKKKYSFLFQTQTKTLFILPMLFALFAREVCLGHAADPHPGETLVFNKNLRLEKGSFADQKPDYTEKRRTFKERSSRSRKRNRGKLNVRRGERHVYFYRKERRRTANGGFITMTTRTTQKDGRVHTQKMINLYEKNSFIVQKRKNNRCITTLDDMRSFQNYASPKILCIE